LNLGIPKKVGTTKTHSHDSVESLNCSLKDVKLLANWASALFRLLLIWSGSSEKLPVLNSKNRHFSSTKRQSQSPAFLFGIIGFMSQN
jgi:hypothetical protein